MQRVDGSPDADFQCTKVEAFLLRNTFREITYYALSVKVLFPC